MNVYLPDDLAAAVKRARIPMSGVCQRALEAAVEGVERLERLGISIEQGRPMSQPADERIGDLRRSAAAVRWAAGPREDPPPALVEPIGAAYALDALKNTHDGVKQWVFQAESLAAAAAAVAVARRLGAPAMFVELLERRVEAESRALEGISLSTDPDVQRLLLLLADLEELCHPAPPLAAPHATAGRRAKASPAR